MKSFDIHMLSLRELEESEMLNLRGGFIPITLTIAVLLSAIENFQDIREGLSDGLYKSKPRYAW